MCARYHLIASAKELIEWFKLRKQLELELELAPRYNIAPTQPVGVVRLAPRSGGRTFELMRWGLIPAWAKEAPRGAPLINARVETAATKPSFRDALRRRRCLMPCSGYYEWKTEGAAKQPYWIRMREAPLMAFAALWETWTGPEGEVIASCALLTTAATGPLRAIHERMPVILPARDYDAWLDPAQQDGEASARRLRPLPDGLLEAVPVSPFVNNVRHEGPECIAPA